MSPRTSRAALKPTPAELDKSPFGRRLLAGPGTRLDEARGPHPSSDLEVRHTGEEPKVIPDYLIIDEIRRRQEDQWEPEPLRLPLYVPQWPPRSEDEDSDEPKSRVIIIDRVGD